MTGNWLRASVIGLALTPLSPAMAADQDKAASPAATLDTVVVTAGRTEEAIKELTTNITIIDEKAIETSSANDLGDLMRQQGFQIYDSKSSNSTLYMRGQGGSTNDELRSRVLVLLNGNRTGTNNLAMSGMQNIERIEIVRGPAATQYGAAAMGGVVNIITKKGEEGLKAKAEVGMGSNNLNKEELTLSGGAHSFDFAVAVNRSEMDDFQTATGDTWRHTRYKSKIGADLDLGYTFMENHRVSVHFNSFEVDGQQLPFSGLPDSLAWPDSFSEYDKTVNNTSLKYAGATDDKLFSWQGSYTFGNYKTFQEGYYDVKDDRTSSTVPPFGQFRYPEVGRTRDDKTDLSQAQLQATFDNQLISLTAGGEYMKYDMDVTGITMGKSVTRDKSKYENLAGYLIGKLKLFDDSLIFSAGGRYDSYELTEYMVTGDTNKTTHFSPSVGVAWVPLRSLKLRANYSEGFAVPSPVQILGDGANYEPNYSLKPEKSDNIEVGADWSWHYINASLTYFHSNYEDKIVSQSHPSIPGRYIYQNMSGAVFAGPELSLSADIGQALEQGFELRPYLNLTYMTERENKDKRAGYYVPQDPEVMSYVPKLTASYGLSFNHPELALSATLNASYFGKNWSQDFNSVGRGTPEQTTPTQGEYIDFGGFTVVDLSVVKRIWDFEDRGNLSLRVEVNNMFNQDYAYTMDYPMPGRNFYVGLHFEY